MNYSITMTDKSNHSWKRMKCSKTIKTKNSFETGSLPFHNKMIRKRSCYCSLFVAGNSEGSTIIDLFTSRKIDALVIPNQRYGLFASNTIYPMREISNIFLFGSVNHFIASNIGHNLLESISIFLLFC